MSAPKAATHAEAELLFQQAVDYHLGRNGRFCNPKKAQKLYAKAVIKGSAKAALNLGHMYHTEATQSADSETYLKHVEALFTHAARLGRPDGLRYLSEVSGQGDADTESSCRAERFMLQAAEFGCVSSMMTLGTRKLHDKSQANEGVKWLLRALQNGSGDAAAVLASHAYEQQGDVEHMLHLLRQGCAKGSAKCIRRLAFIHEVGQFGQKPDPQYAKRLFALLKELDPTGAPSPIADFEERFAPGAAIKAERRPVDAPPFRFRVVR